MESENVGNRYTIKKIQQRSNRMILHVERNFMQIDPIGKTIKIYNY